MQTATLPDWARQSEVKAGDVLIADGGFFADDPNDPSNGNFRCLDEGQECLVSKDQDGLFVKCQHGQHYLNGQLGYTPETTGRYVGFVKK